MSMGLNCSRGKFLDEYEVALLSWKETENWAFDPHLAVHLPANESRETLPKAIQMQLQRFQDMGAKVIFHRLSFLDLEKERFNSSPEKARGVNLDMECLAGAYLRLEIPKVLEEAQLLEPRHHQKYLLWTDCDIMWWRQVLLDEFLQSIPSHKFSVAMSGQLWKTEGPVNDGVMLMNIPNYKQDMFRIMDYINSSQRWPGADQHTLNSFYDEHPGRSDWSVEWNYRMFWDGSEKVAIVHFWGVKPSKGLDCWIQRHGMEECPPIARGLIPAELQSKFQNAALEMALENNLTFLKPVVSWYKRLFKMVKKI